MSETVSIDQLLDEYEEKDVVELSDLMHQMAVLRRRRDELDLAEGTLKEMLKDSLAAFGISGVTTSHGTAYVTEGSTRTSYAKDNIKKAMLENGVPAKKINIIMEKAATVSVGKPSLTFKPKKED